MSDVSMKGQVQGMSGTLNCEIWTNDRKSAFENELRLLKRGLSKQWGKKRDDEKLVLGEDAPTDDELVDYLMEQTVIPTETGRWEGWYSGLRETVRSFLPNRYLIQVDFEPGATTEDPDLECETSKPPRLEIQSPLFSSWEEAETALQAHMKPIHDDLAKKFQLVNISLSSMHPGWSRGTTNDLASMCASALKHERQRWTRWLYRGDDPRVFTPTFDIARDTAEFWTVRDSSLSPPIQSRWQMETAPDDV